MTGDDAIPPSIAARGDWRRVAALYRQFSRVAADTGTTDAPSDDITSGLAEALARTFASYEDSEGKFIDDLAEIMGNIDAETPDPVERYRRLYRDIRLNRFSAYNPAGDVRRRPRPFEAAVETVRRIEDLNAVRDVLEGLPSSAILGGSVSYGRFYNTAGSMPAKATDTDLVLVLPSYDDLPRVEQALRALAARTPKMIDERSLDELAARAQTFPAIRAEHERCGFQQKLRFWQEDPDLFARYQIPCHYSFALHVLDDADFRYVALRDLPSIPAQGFVRRMMEYRGDRGAEVDDLRSFAGHARPIPLHAAVVDGGYLADTLIAEIVDKRFYPGVLMNLILPQFEVRWESPAVRVRLTLLGLRWKLLSRLTEERQMRTYEVQRISLSHTRSAAFAPHVRRRADRE